MKRIFLKVVPVISSLVIFSCATKPTATTPTVGPEKTNTATETVNPLAPQILEMGFSDSMGKSSTSIQKLKSGKQAVIYLRLKDSEWNLAGVTITAECGNKKAAPISIEFDYQYQEEFVFAESLDVPDEKGNWTFTAVAYDHGGQRSKVAKTTVVVE